MINDNHKSSATGRGSGCCLQRLVSLLDELLPYLMLMVGYLWGFFWGMLYQERQKIEVNRENIKCGIICPGTGMLLDNAVFRQDLYPLVVWRKCDLVTLTNKLQQNAATFWWQSRDISNASLVNSASPLESSPPINKPSNDNQWWNASKQPTEDVMPHDAKRPN